MSVYARVAGRVALDESRALTVKEKLPDWTGVPAIRPEALRDNPRGSAPAATLQL